MTIAKKARKIMLVAYCYAAILYTGTILVKRVITGSIANVEEDKEN